jgi:putative membrane protein
MIVRRRPKALELLLLMKGSTIPKIAPQLGVVFGFAVAVMLIEHHFMGAFRSFAPAPFTLMGIALSVFLGFRNNACYDRWWEARRHWGHLILETRSFARLVTTVLPKDERREQLLHEAIAFAYAAGAYLRGVEIPAQVGQYCSAETMREVVGCRNAPDAILRCMGEKLAAALKEGVTTDIVFTSFNELLNEMSAVQVACERIATTPTPFTYSLLLHRTAYLFCFLLPFSLVTTLGYATPLFCVVVAYTFFGLDALGDELEEPFGENLNALPLSALARTVEINVLEAMGERNLPPALLPVEYVLR